MNSITKQDRDDLYNLLKVAGIAPSDFNQKFTHNVEMRDVVLSVYENSTILKRIDEMVEPIIQNNDAKVVLFCSAILKTLGLKTKLGFIRSISKIYSYEVLSKAGEAAYEFVDFAHDRVEPHSALFSEFFIKRYLQPDEIVGVIFRMAKEAAKRMNEDRISQSERIRSARSTLGALLRFSFLKKF